jgi:hypothetical protein
MPSTSSARVGASAASRNWGDRQRERRCCGKREEGRGEMRWQMEIKRKLDR